VRISFFSSLHLIFIALLGSSAIQFFPLDQAYSQDEFRQREFVEEGKPTLTDSNLKVEQVVEGLDTPTTMAFLRPNDILVLGKDTGSVKRILNGKLLYQPLLDVNVANSVERCMCGIAISKNNSTTYVFLYYTEIEGNDGEDREGREPLANRLYRYQLVNDKLVNPTLLLDLPATPGPRHNGGAIIIGPDNNLYVPVGDIDGSFKEEETETQAQNYNDGVEPDGRSGILRITQDGQPVGEGILGNSIPLKLYYAYGIRNSFGLAFDPVTGKLWATENGPEDDDEINLVEPGFNSGWVQVHGLARLTPEFDPSELVDFDKKGNYRDPELVWQNTAGPTAVLFMTSDKMGSQYVNDMFVADVHHGSIYHFKLNADRTHLALPPQLDDKVISNSTADVLDEIIFGENFGGITDLKIGPDGYLYVVSVGLGKIFRIAPR
jgi:glucose/arabinose dehydrogenase